jgi:hypothetical protein
MLSGDAHFFAELDDFQKVQNVFWEELSGVQEVW